MYDEGERSSVIYIYLSLSQMGMESYTEAEATLDEFIQSDLLESSKGYWYKALLFLARGDLPDSEKILRRIIDEKLYNYQLAEELLDEL